ncbi:extracellular solute-binding protein [Salisediminibacterium halotolerans]|uniref:Multiple sugar transport system substrate-binding protein n=1 Tax=Salisediminibacterium halotolerans TaxID=517425 RepID=A0A1H9R2C4_9BACI|nr:extracellular solute-binding protein [Salisediminibacterium haloalkalitolerans]SER66864.1 multiple sugar transport system substrate-binding protein [Salisediminibacterium haloalkalitolerans]
MSKRALYQKGLILMFIFGLTSACSDDEPARPVSDDNGFGFANENAENAEEPEEEVTLTYARSYDATGATEQLIDEFEESHPNIRIDYTEMPSDTNEARKQYIEVFTDDNKELDVFEADMIWMEEFADERFVLNLDPYIEEHGISMNEFFDGAQDAAEYADIQWAMPQTMDIGLLYYRSDIVDEPAETWEDLLSDAEELAGEEETQYGYLFQAGRYEGLNVNALEIIRGYGGELIDEDGDVTADSEETIKAIEMLIELVNADSTPENILDFDESHTHYAFINGSAVFARNWPYMQSLTEEEYTKTAPLPAESGESSAVLGGMMAMIYANTEYPDEAWTFLEFMTGEEGQKINAEEGGRAPSRETLYEDSDVTEAVPLFADEDFVNTLEEARPRFTGRSYHETSENVQEELHAAVSGEQTAAETSANLQEMLEEIVD